MNKTFPALVAILCLQNVLFGSDKQLDVCDVSFLWPVPQTQAAAESLISAEEALTQEGEFILPQQVFDDILGHAEATSLTDSGQVSRIEFLDRTGRTDDRLKSIQNWKLAAIRVDPSAPGCSSKIRLKFGSTAQIRLVLQPVIVENGSARAHDMTMHLVFSYVKNQVPPFEADTVRFSKIVDHLLEIKETIATAGIKTTGAKLSVHPGFESTSVDLTELLRRFLKSHLSSQRLAAVAFMGIQSGAEPWIFFATSRDAQTGRFVPARNHPSLGGSAAQMLSFVTPTTVFPKPVNRQFGPSSGVATDLLFSVFNPDQELFPDATEAPLNRMKARDIADIIANPDLSHFFTTDCVSCHTESSLRASTLAGAPTEFAYRLPDGISGIDPEMLPKNTTPSNWNVRNFGWGFQSFGGNMVPAVTMRTANEAAESAEFINETYLSNEATSTSEEESSADTSDEDSSDDDDHHMVAKALTLIMKCKSQEDYDNLEAQIKALLKRDDNPINKALDEIGNVHFARFVFLEDSQQVAVITSYDGDFESYIIRFSEKIGDIFNLILEHVEGAESMRNNDGKIRVQDHVQAFLEFIDERDLEAVEPFYSAYPDLTVQQIRRLKKDAEHATE